LLEKTLKQRRKKTNKKGERSKHINVREREREREKGSFPTVTSRHRNTYNCFLIQIKLLAQTDV